MYDYNWKQERIDSVMKEIGDMSFTDVARLILNERFHRKAKEYEVNWLDDLANALRDGDSFDENTLYKEVYGDPWKELIKLYKNA
jgi:hypothetical protein